MRLATSATTISPPNLSTLHPSLTNAAQSMPISDRQYTATSTDAGARGVCAMLQAVTRGEGERRSNEWTVWGVGWKVVAMRASPQPMSAMVEGGRV